MLRPLWETSETYVSYHDVVDKWGSANALAIAKGDGGYDKVSAAIAIEIIFSGTKPSQIIKDLDKATTEALSKHSEWTKLSNGTA